MDTIDERSDVFGLGGILCDVLTGGAPHQGAAHPQVFRRAQEGDLADCFARLAASGAEEEIIALAKDCLAPQPSDRPDHAGVVADRVSSYLTSVQERLHRAEIARAAADVEAVEERKRWRVTMAWSLTTVTALTLGMLGWLWVRSDREARLAVTLREVNRALGEAEQLWAQAKAAPSGDLTPWLEALAAAERADALLKAGTADEPTSLRVQQTLASIQSEHHEADANFREAGRERALAERVLEIRLERGEEADREKADRDYTQALSEFGIPVDELGPAEIAARILAHRPIALELAAALDDWVMLRKRLSRDPATWQRLVEAANRADADPWRVRLRQLADGNDPAALRGHAAEVDVARLPLPSLHLMGQALQTAGDAPEAVAWLRTAQRLHPGDFWLNLQLSNALAAISPVPWDEVVQYRTAALAARPNNPDVLALLARALDRAGRRDEAEAHFRQLVLTHPEHRWGSTWLVEFAARHRSTDVAIATFREALANQPDAAPSRAALGLALMRTGDRQNGIAECREAVRQDSQSSDIQRCLGMALLESGSAPEAATIFQQLLKQEPANASLHQNLARRWPERAGTATRWPPTGSPSACDLTTPMRTAAWARASPKRAI